jgi:hypothetical protein
MNKENSIRSEEGGVERSMAGGGPERSRDGASGRRPQPSRRSSGTRPKVHTTDAVTPKLSKVVTTKMVALRPLETDPTTMEKRRLLFAITYAEGRSSIQKAIDAYLAAGFPIPDSQEFHIQMLEHSDESLVRESLDRLCALLAKEPPQRRPVMDQRARRLEQFAEEPATRESACALRRKL